MRKNFFLSPAKLEGSKQDVWSVARTKPIDLAVAEAQDTLHHKHHEAYTQSQSDLSSNLCSPFLRAIVIFSKALTFLGLNFSICKIQTINVVISEPSPTKHC